METEKIISNSTLDERAKALIEYHKKIGMPRIPSLEELKAGVKESIKPGLVEQLQLWNQ